MRKCKNYTVIWELSQGKNHRNVFAKIKQTFHSQEEIANFVEEQRKSFKVNFCNLNLNIFCNGEGIYEAKNY